MIDGGYEIDIEAVIQNIQEAEVITLHFPMLRQTLLIDTRGSNLEGPLVRVVPMVRNTEERFTTLKALRPELSRPRSITMIPWARSVATLDSTGVWPHVLARLEACGTSETLVEARRAFRQLRSLELVELREAIVGKQYRTVWRATSTDRAEDRS